MATFADIVLPPRFSAACPREKRNMTLEAEAILGPYLGSRLPRVLMADTLVV
jgi:hypothetical protein